jgi:iron complex transport system ATP-binding protein
VVSALLEIAGLAYGYSGHEVGSGVSFAVEGGEILCLLGPNGGGKTTLFKTILGLLPPLGGTVTVAGENSARWSARRRALVFGYVPQSGAGQFSFTVLDMVLMGRVAHRGPFAAPGAADRSAAEVALETLGIAPLRNRDWLKISGGERQLALIARALAQQPRILVLDEPTANLDFGNQLRVLAQVRRLAAERLAVIFSTHHPEQAFACAHRVAMLQPGGLRRWGRPAEVITESEMQQVYGIDVEVVPAGTGGALVCLPRSRS